MPNTPGQPGGHQPDGHLPDGHLPSDGGGASAVVSGTITGGVSESDVVAGGLTLVITLTGDTWIAASGGSGHLPGGHAPGGHVPGGHFPGSSGSGFDAIRQDIIDGISSVQIAAGLSVGDVVRTSDTVVTITLPVMSYDIASDETFSVTVPASAVDGAAAIVATPTVLITAVAVSEPVEDPPSGGYGAKNYYDAYLQRKRARKRRKKRVELEEIEADIDRRIARELHRKLEREVRDKEIAELEAIVASLDVRAETERLRDYGDELAKAFTKAYMARTFSAFESFERQLERLHREEEALLWAVVLLD